MPIAQKKYTKKTNGPWVAAPYASLGGSAGKSAFDELAYAQPAMTAARTV
jgi:hypothetical protein